MNPISDELNWLLSIAPYLVDSRVGIMQEVGEKPGEAGTPDFFHYYGRACNTQVFAGQDNFAHTGGASTQREIAFAKAVGEGVERYCSAIYDLEQLPLSSFQDAPFRCVDPSSFALYSQAQYDEPGFRLVPFTPATPVRWTPAVHPPTGEIWHVPAVMIYVPYFFRDAKAGSPVAQSISTGLACHVGWDRAVRSGICEVVERDAFTLFWQARITSPQIRVETLDDSNYGLVRRFEEVGYTVVLLNLTTDVGIPTVLSILCSASRNAPARVFAAASSLNPTEAVRKSLEELAHTRRYSQLLMSNMPPVVSRPPLYEDIEDQVGHLGYWANHDNVSPDDFYLAGEQRISLDELPDHSTGDPAADVRQLCAMIEAVGHQVLVADLTTPDVRALGLSVVHALVPGFHPLYMGHLSRALGGNRLWSVPQKMGYPGITPANGDNPLPHPYP
jgi:ribosomal protein S12 methylthiotransferase accessory factor